MTGAQKAAILICLMGEDAASMVFKNLSEHGLWRMTQAIGELETSTRRGATDP